MQEIIVVRGGGDLATGTIHRLWSAGFQVLVLEAERPSAIRRQVCLCEAVYEGTASVEGLTAERIADVQEMEAVWRRGNVPVLVDPGCTCLERVKPAVLVDAILAKKNLGTHRGMAPLTIALGPGFTAGVDVDVVVETVRGHSLGRVITSGGARPNTGVPGIVGGYGKERVIYAPSAGILRNVSAIGQVVQKGSVIAQVKTGEGTVEVHATIPGLVRGLLRDGSAVTEGFKIADIDPRVEERENCCLISDKSRCIAGSVLEQVCAAARKRKDFGKEL